MAKIKIAGDALVITSDRTLEEIKKLEKYNPSALTLVETNSDGTKSEVFKIGTTNSVGTIGKYGASFSSVSKTGDGLATITAIIPSDVEDAVAYASDNVGYAVLQLSKVEAQFDDALAAVEAQKASILDAIVIA